jgi:hypothetical protein
VPNWSRYHSWPFSASVAAKTGANSNRNRPTTAQSPAATVKPRNLGHETFRRFRKNEA